MATAWSNQTTLRERLTRAESEALPAPGDFADLMTSLPSAQYTWYSGTRLGGGLLAYLDHASGPWVVLSSALVGLRFTPANNEDPLSLRVGALAPRVKLVTLSLGGNDLCQDEDPAGAPDFKKRLTEFKQQFAPSTAFVVWQPPQVAEVAATILKRIDALPPTPGRDKLRAYCQTVWTTFSCSALSASASQIDSRHARLVQMLNDVFGPLFDPYAVGLQSLTDPLDLIAADCFHPSRLAQKAFATGTADFLRAHYGYP
jgi:lysophospholipase L1-like esterase